MKLKRFKITNYRSVLDSGWVDIDDIAVIVGKNESGKTSLLKALWKLNPASGEKYDLNREWPRGHRRERSPEKTVVEAEFEFDDEERGILAEIHDSAKGIESVRIRKNYEGTFYYTFQPHHPENAVDAKWIVSVFDEHLSDDVFEGASDHFLPQYQQLLDEFIAGIREGGSIAYAKENIPIIKAKIAEFAHPQLPNQQQDLQVIQRVHAALDAALEEADIAPPFRQAIDTAHEWLPTFIYMDDYRIFNGAAFLDQVQDRFKQNKPSDEDKTIRLIMEQAGLDLDEEVAKGNDSDREQRMLDMNDASLTLTQEIADRWSQKQYEVKFEADGQHFIMFVKDLESPALVPLEERSKGFQWFFSFDMLFMAETGGEFANCVILLDEPGLHLHAKAQEDLLARMRAYAEDNQLIYSTHLPFMIDSSRLDNIWVCEERGRDGVKVHKDWASADGDARFTLQAAMGISWSQSMFIGRYNLVVEGVTDFWYLKSVSEMLIAAGEEGLHDDLVITPAGGASRAAYLATVLKGQDLNVAVLLDSDPEGRTAFEQIVHQWILKDDHVFMLADVIEQEGDRCIEDLLDDEFYLGFVSECYKKELGKKTVKLPAADKRTLVQRVEAALAEKDVESFNKGRPAKKIMEAMATMSLDDLPGDTVDNFRKIIATINAALDRWKSTESEAK
jgi:predicted ATP-dependent endonuclease of OLD family